MHREKPLAVSTSRSCSEYQKITLKNHLYVGSSKLVKSFQIFYKLHVHLYSVITIISGRIMPCVVYCMIFGVLFLGQFF